MSRSDRLVGQSREIAHLAGQELQRRLEEGPTELSMKELGVTRGIEMDKIAAYEGWRSGSGPGDSDFITELRKIVAEQADVKLTLKVTKHDDQSESPVIDVTPSEDEIG